jgi:hypothetical protein
LPNTFAGFVALIGSEAAGEIVERESDAIRDAVGDLVVTAAQVLYETVPGYDST